MPARDINTVHFHGQYIEAQQLAHERVIKSLDGVK